MMSVAYEPRYHDGSPYAPVGENDHDHDHSDLNKYINTEANVDMADLAAATYDPSGDEPSPFDTSSPGLDLVPIASPNVDPTNVPIHETSPTMTDGDNMTRTPLKRSMPIPKPDRPVTKNEDGRYVCQHTGCNEAIRTFSRKCEWSKHMDKHERPYVCTVPGCEKVQGFTYSGGLLRHEREVHGKHGGPKKAMFCPHPTCKRSGGKGFSRLENLQEHLRRVHTTSATAAPLHSPEEHQASRESTSDMASAAFAFINSSGSKSPNDSLLLNDNGGGGGGGGGGSSKRKRSEDDLGGRDEADGGAAAQEEIKRLREENIELRRQLQEQTRHADEMRARLLAVNTAISQTLAEPLPPAL